MKKKVTAFCLSVILLCSGCTNKAESEAAMMPENGVQETGTEVMIFYEETDQNLEFVVSYIEEKMNGKRCLISEKGQIPWNPKQGELIFIGGIETEEGLSQNMKDFLNKMDFQGKKVVPFWLTKDWQEESPYEKALIQTLSSASVAPGIGIPWGKEREKEELGRIDGWLTTACTWEEKKTF